MLCHQVKSKINELLQSEVGKLTLLWKSDDCSRYSPPHLLHILVRDSVFLQRAKNVPISDAERAAEGIVKGPRASREVQHLSSVQIKHLRIQQAHTHVRCRVQGDSRCRMEINILNVGQGCSTAEKHQFSFRILLIKFFVLFSALKFAKKKKNTQRKSQEKVFSGSEG